MGMERMAQKSTRGLAGLLLRHAVMIGLVAAYIGVTVLFGCPFRSLTGAPCPGCGMTRAFLLLLQGDASGAFLAHPLYPVAPLMLFYAAHSHTRLFSWIDARIRTLLLALVGVLFFGVYILRLVSGRIM